MMSFPKKRWPKWLSWAEFNILIPEFRKKMSSFQILHGGNPPLFFKGDNFPSKLEYVI